MGGLCILTLLTNAGKRGGVERVRARARVCEREGERGGLQSLCWSPKARFLRVRAFCLCEKDVVQCFLGAGV